MDDLAQLDQAMARLADGDRSAIDAVFHTLWPHVALSCEKMLGPGGDADDAAQEAMQKVFAQAHRYDRTRRALPWALAVAAWECRTVRKRRQRSRTAPLDSISEASDGGASPEDAVILRDLVQAAETVFAGLSESDREALQRAFTEETEERLSISGATLRKRRERAIRRLRETWRKLSIGALLFATGVVFLWHGRELGRGALAGVLAGLVPLAFGVCVRAYQGLCHGAMFMPGCVAACVVGGIAAGTWLAFVAARQPAGVAFVASAAGLALLTGAMGCSCAGPVGVAGMLVGLLVPVGPVVFRAVSRLRA